MGVAIVVLTYDRVHLLRQCVENVIGRTSPLTEEIVIWNNGSSDGTRSYLDMLADPRIRVVHHEAEHRAERLRPCVPRTRRPTTSSSSTTT